MSQWTHVAAIFRLDSIGGISDESKRADLVVKVKGATERVMKIKF